MKYLARHNKVWQHIKSGKLFPNSLELKEDEKLTDYKQVPKPKGQPKEHQIEKPWTIRKDDK